ncbi:MAG: tetratricopeptide repeat protein [Verrucomicrobiaceae bacterium]|nr:tetratricopeptide repeat protein [Verrucomicrobiaceae bacterium]
MTTFRILPRLSKLVLLGAAATFCVTGAGVARAQPAKRALPVEDDSPPVPKATPFSPGTPPKAAIVGEPGGAKKPADSGKPKGPDDDLYDYASMLYERKEYGLAAESFGQYLQRYPSGSRVPMSLFRLGECYVNENQVGDAEKYFLEVVNRYPASEGAPSAAYRLGAIRFNGKNFDESARYFAFCEAKTPFPQIKLAAAYNKSRAYQMLGDRKKMMAALQSVAAVKQDNPYLESALLSLATALLGEDKKKEALGMFRDLIEASKDKLIVSDALVKAGVIEAENGKPDDALKHFEEALKLTETSVANRGLAFVGTVQALYAKGDHDGVIDVYNRNAAVLPPGDLRPKMLLLVGNAFRMKKMYSRAVEVYLMIEKDYKDSEQAFEAGYWKLYCFYLIGDKDLPEFARNFVSRYRKERGDHEFISLAQLILADAYFNKQEFKEAAVAFVDVRTNSLPERLRPEAMFNKGWAEAEAGRHQDAIGSFTRFITEYPKHEFISRALARRGLSNREVRDLAKAKEDFTRVVKEFPKSDAAELSWLQIGLIHTEKHETKEMIAAFESLVEKFPSSPAAAQAWYGIGSGRYDQKEFDKAVEALRKSVALDKKNFLDKASPRIVMAWYYKQDADGLAKAIDDYRDANANASIPPNVLTWLGFAFFNKSDFARSARFLTYATMDDAGVPTPAVWDYLARAWLELKKYNESKSAIDKLLQNPPDPGAKARALLTKGRALLGLANFGEGHAVAQEALQIVKDGKLQAQLMILEGDIFDAEGAAREKAGDRNAAMQKWKEAAGKFVMPSQMIVDPELTPEALFKAARALDRAGDTAQAEKLLKQLKAHYPSYVPPGY